MSLIRRKDNILGDGIGFVEYHDFSTANMSDDKRLLTITTVASICYHNTKAIGKQSLYDRLLSESGGLPSSSFEFVPVLLSPRKEPDATVLGDINSPIRKWGEWLTLKDESGRDTDYLLTNFRAMHLALEEKLKDFEDYYGQTGSVLPETLREEVTDRYLTIYNTAYECTLIKEHFKVFLYKVDMPTRSQMVRHRTNWQELSRRYVNGDRVAFDFYISEKMKNIEVDIGYQSYDGSSITADTEQVFNICLALYNEALAKGVKPEEARRCIPQGAYTQIWGAFQPMYLKNFFKLRLDAHAQKEIRLVAQAMQELING